VSGASCSDATISAMTRIVLIPTRTADGRHLVLRPVVLTPAQRLQRLADRLGLPGLKG
jgi:hypothetical protein